MEKQFYDTDLFVYASGLPVCSVCIPEDMPEDRMEELTNKQNPTGVDSKWKVSKDKEFVSGEPMPNKCEKYPQEKRLHYLLNC